MVTTPASHGAAPRLVRFGAFELDLSTGELTRQGRRVALQDQPARLLSALVSKPHQIVTREELRRALWSDDTFVDFETALSAAVMKVRQALGDSATSPRFIETVPKRGYRFLAEVRRPGIPGDASIGFQAAEPPAQARASRRRLYGVGLAVAALVGLIVLAGLMHYNRPAAATARPTIAVLPFSNLTGDDALDYLASGLSAALRSRLSELSAVHVLSRAQVAAGGNTDPAALVRSFEVERFVEADLHGSAHALRVALSVTDGLSGRVLWTETIAGDVDRLIGLQEQLAKGVTRYLELPIAFREGRRLQASPTSSERAYDVYLRALSLLDRDQTSPELRRVALDRLTRAVQLDPRFARAWSALADVHLRLYAVTNEVAHLDAAEDSATRAVALDARLPEARLVMAQLLRVQGQPEEAERQVKEVLAGLPRPADAYRILAWSQLARGDQEAAIASHRAATQVAPDDWTVWNSLGLLMVSSSRFDEAEEAYRRAAQLAPAGVIAPQAGVARALQRQGRFEEAVQAYAEIARPIRDPVLATNIGVAYYFLDRPDRYTEAQRYFELAVELDPGHPELRGNLAAVYRITGQAERAREEYRAAYGLMRERAKTSPLDPVGEGRLAQFAARVEECHHALEVADRLQAEDPARGQVHTFLAYAFALCGARDRALRGVARAIELGEAPAVFAELEEVPILRGDPDLTRLTTPSPR